MTSDLTIRELRAEDRVDVCRIWVDGLTQSRLAVHWPFRHWFMQNMQKMRDASLSETGDIGPNGKNLLHTYGGKDDRCMFVACLGSQKVIVGCCSVKKGMDEIKPEPDSQTGSIWRMSVDESYRGYGTATALMAACETWSRKAGCTKMGLFTINPVAANFYVNRMGYTAVDHFHVAKTAFSKLVVPPVFQYEKALC